MVYYTGDIHGSIYRILDFIDRNKLAGGDMIVILGDAGLNYYGNEYGDAKRKRRLNDAGVTIFCIHGNHERRPSSTGTYDEVLWRGGVAYCEPEFPNLLFAKDGELYSLGGHQAFVIGGAYSVDKFYRLEIGSKWFPDEQPSAEIKARVEGALKDMGGKVDIILSHTCPSKYIPVEAFLPGLSQDTVDRSTEDWLDAIEDVTQYAGWLCGHWHIDKCIDKMRFLYEDFITI